MYRFFFPPQLLSPATVFARAVLIVGAVLSSGTAQAQDGTVRGEVLSAETSDPLSGVNVVAQSNAIEEGTSTDIDGTFRLAGLPPGTYQFRFSTVGYDSRERTVTVQAGDTTVLTVRLAPQPIELEDVVVSASRQREDAESVPTSVSVLDREALDQQTRLTSDVGDMLAQTVPGLAPSTGSLSNFGQTIRGRSLFVLIDGVPQTVQLRNVLRDLRTIDPGAVERIEVVRGASATYGYGSNGGLVNFITERPNRSGVQGELEIGTRSQPSDVASSASGRIRGEVQAKKGRYDGLLSVGTEEHGYFFDGEGDRIPQDPQGQGGLAGSNETNVLARGGVQITPEQRLDLSVNFYRFRQDIEYETVAGTPGEEKATARAVDDAQGENPGTRNVVASLQYAHDDLLGSRVSTQVYVQDYQSRFGFVSFFPDGGGQSVLDAEKFGARLDVTTPLPFLPGGEVQWGTDVLRDETAQPLEDGRTNVPEMRQWSVAPFAQARFPLGDRLRLRGGLRFEPFWLDVDDYTTLFGGRDVEGGDLTYDALVFNAGGVLRIVDGLNFFTSFSQGFSVPDVGRVLRSPPPEAEDFSVEALRPEAQTVNSFELGLRGDARRLDASLVAFVNTSDLGSTFGDFPELRLQRAPERVFGLEGELDLQVHEAVRVGGTATVIDGERDVDDDGDFGEDLPNSRIPPAKITSYVSVAPGDRWQARVQLLHVGSRDEFDGEAETVFGQGDVNAHTVVDLSASVDAGPGNVSVGVENLFDNFYFPAVSQWWNLGTGFSTAPGRELSLGYTVQF